MRHINPCCRSRLSKQDIEFITSVLCRTRRQSKFLHKLLIDPEARDIILDEMDLYHAVLESTETLTISLHLYFYLLVRKSLREASIDNRELADYIAVLLSDWTQSGDFNRNIHTEGRACYAYATDLWNLIASADEHARYDILVYMGNHYLFMTGVFPEHIRDRARRTGSPRIRFYEEHGRQGFKLAAEHRLAAQEEMQPLYRLLGECFSAIRNTLNDISSRQTFIGF